MVSESRAPPSLANFDTSFGGQALTKPKSGPKSGPESRIPSPESLVPSSLAPTTTGRRS
jgi:hypothetical protein